MSATSAGGVIGAAIDGLSGEDSIADGAAIGAVVGNIVKLVAPLMLTYIVGYAVLRGAKALKERAID